MISGPPEAQERVSSWCLLLPLVMQLAARQWGHVTRRQLLALGVTRADIRHRVADGTVVVVHAGFYAGGYRRL